MKRQLGRTSRRCEDNRKWNLNKQGGKVGWVYVCYNRGGLWRAFVNTVMNLGIPQNTNNFLIDWENTDCLLFDCLLLPAPLQTLTDPLGLQENF